MCLYLRWPKQLHQEIVRDENIVEPPTEVSTKIRSLALGQRDVVDMSGTSARKAARRLAALRLVACVVECQLQPQKLISISSDIDFAITQK